MLKSLEFSAPTVDDAIKSVLEHLNKQREDISVEILEKGRSGFFGIGSAPAKIKVSYEIILGDIAKDFVENILKFFPADFQTNVTEDAEQKNISINISGSKAAMIIGRHGETLNALQFLTTMAVNQRNEPFWHITIDAENYRAKKDEELTLFAKKMASKVARFRKPITLEPMNAYDRRIVHSILKGFQGVSTISVGAEPRRCIVIRPSTDSPVNSAAKSE